MGKRYLLLLFLILILGACSVPAEQHGSASPAVPASATAVASLALPSATAVPPSPSVPLVQTAVQATTDSNESPATAYPAPSEPDILSTPYPGVEKTAETYPPKLETDPVDVYPAPATAVETPHDVEIGSSKVGETVWGYRVVDEFPHDALAYTQGLVVEQGLATLLESTGRESSLRRVDLETGTPVQQLELPDQYFGEGMTLLNDKVVQLTWREQVGFVYDAETFERIGTFNYPHEGWGLTHDGSRLIVSDGTDVIRFWDPVTFEETGRIAVRSLSGPVTKLNELEYVDGEIWANVWYSDRIARISPQDGRVLGWVDLTGIISPELRADPQSVLNGIAYDAESDRLFVTGKNWPTLFEIEIVKSDTTLSQ